MFRFRRVNIDGKSITETRVTGDDVYPGSPVILSDNEFSPATAGTGRLYVAMPAYHHGKGIGDVVAEGETLVADYMEQGREFAIRVPAGTYNKDAAITVGANGFALFVAPSEGGEADPIVAYCQETVTLEAVDFIRVRIA